MAADNRNALDWYNSLEDDLEYKAEEKKIEFAFAVHRRMGHLGMSKSDLADKASTSNAYITKILRGDSNLTIESLVKFADAVAGDLQIHISPREAEGRWIDMLSQRSPSKEYDEAPVWARSSLEGLRDAA